MGHLLRPVSPAGVRSRRHERFQDLPQHGQKDFRAQRPQARHDSESLARDTRQPSSGIEDTVTLAALLRPGQPPATP